MTSYVTNQDDTWDLISYAVYGSETRIAELMEANPLLIGTAVFEAGVTIDVPVLAEPDEPYAGLPPWRR